MKEKEKQKNRNFSCKLFQWGEKKKIKKKNKKNKKMRKNRKKWEKVNWNECGWTNKIKVKFKSNLIKENMKIKSNVNEM